MRAILLVTMAILGTAGVAAAAPPAVIAVEARIDTAGGAPVTGESLYRRLCASCHGVGGRGDGPAGAALCRRPPDLTRLRSGMPELMRQIDGRRTIRAHGTAQMPVWGEVLEQSLISEPHRRRTTLLKVDAIADYVMRLRRAAPSADTPASR
jgi:mono/diheme cytochrome c family protein